MNGVSLLGELTPRTIATLLSYGERLSVRIMSSVLNSMGVPAQYFDAWNMGMKTSNDYLNADVLDESYSAIGKTISKLDKSMYGTFCD